MPLRSKIYLLLAFLAAALLVSVNPYGTNADYNGWVCRMAKGFGYCTQNND
jgi:hypothetical protein